MFYFFSCSFFQKSKMAYNLCACFLLFSLGCKAFPDFSNPHKTNTEKIGDALQMALPATGFLMALGNNDEEGRNQFAKSFVANLAITGGLKKSVHKQRPNGNNFESFPSGHTSASFQGASFIQRRYGWIYGLPSYIAAGYVGYSRVHARKHYWEDVFAGATIGVLATYYFTTPHKQIIMTPILEKDKYGLNFQINW